MPKTKAKSCRRVDVHWRDAHAPAPHASYAIGEISTLPSFKPMISTGWLLEEREDAVIVAAEYCPEDDDYRGLTIVPRELLIGIAKQGQRLKPTPPSDPLLRALASGKTQVIGTPIEVPLQFSRVGEEVV